MEPKGVVVSSNFIKSPTANIQKAFGAIHHLLMVLAIIAFDHSLKAEENWSHKLLSDQKVVQINVYRADTSSKRKLYKQLFIDSNGVETKSIVFFADTPHMVSVFRYDSLFWVTSDTNFYYNKKPLNNEVEVFSHEYLLISKHKIKEIETFTSTKSQGHIRPSILSLRPHIHRNIYFINDTLERKQKGYSFGRYYRYRIYLKINKKKILYAKGRELWSTNHHVLKKKQKTYPNYASKVDFKSFITKETIHYDDNKLMTSRLVEHFEHKRGKTQNFDTITYTYEYLMAKNY